MKFEEAMKHLREGKRIKRKTLGNFDTWTSNGCDGYAFSNSSLFADDWIVEEKKVEITREQLIEAVKGISETREYALSHGIDRIINGWSKEVANKIADKLGL